MRASRFVAAGAVHGRTPRGLGSGDGSLRTWPKAMPPRLQRSPAVRAECATSRAPRTAVLAAWPGRCTSCRSACGVVWLAVRGARQRPRHARCCGACMRLAARMAVATSVRRTPPSATQGAFVARTWRTPRVPSPRSAPGHAGSPRACNPHTQRYVPRRRPSPCAARQPVCALTVLATGRPRRAACTAATQPPQPPHTQVSAPPPPLCPPGGIAVRVLVVWRGPDLHRRRHHYHECNRRCVHSRNHDPRRHNK